MNDTAPDRYLVPAVVSAVRILTALAQSGRSTATQVELGRELSLSKSSAHNLLATLEHLELVARDPASRQYRLGPALVGLGRAAQAEMQLLALASRRIGELAAETGLSVAIARVTDGGRVTVVDRVYPTGSLFVGIALGGDFGRFDGAIGKCLLAAMEPEEAARLVRDSELPARTPASITDAGAMLREVAATRARGWSVALGEFNDNHAVAAPLYGPSGDFELLLFALGFPGQLPEANMAHVGALLRESADTLSVACGGRPGAFDGAGSEENTTNGPSQAQETTIT